MSTLLLNGLRAVSVRLWHPWQGAWIAEVDLDLALVPVVPSGPATLKINEALLVGTIDADGSGRFGEKATVRVIGGGGGWHRNVSARQFHNDARVLSSAVILATAAEVGEKAVDLVPTPLGVDFMRTAGPASRVLAGRDWYVTTAGVTTVGPRAPLPATPDIDVLEWDPHQHVATLAADSLIAPGTVLVDTRFDTVTVRDVEQVFTDGKARATAWCSPSSGTGSTRLTKMLQALAREATQPPTLRVHHYRVVSEGVDGRLTLQAVSRTAGIPDSVAIPPWHGLAGCTAKVLPGMEVALVFLDGDPGKPVVVGYSGLDELATPVATQASQAAFVASLVAFVGAMQAFLNFPGIAALSGGTAQPAAAAAAALAATAVLPTNYSLRTKAS